MSRSAWGAGAGLCLVLVTYVLLALPLLDAPLRHDELLYLGQAQAIAERGVPRRDFGETHLVIHPASFVARFGADYGLWHPPAYLYAVALPVALASDDGVAARAFGLACGAGTLVLVFAAALGGASRAGLGARAPAAATLAAGSVASSPYWIDYSVFLDPDTTVYPLVVSAGLLAVIRYKRMRRLLPLALVLTLFHWTKLTAFAFAVGGIAVHAVLMARWRRLATLAIASIAATALFALLWLVYAWLADVPRSWTVDFLRLDKAASASVGSLFDIANTSRGLISFLGLPFLVLSGVSVYGLVRRVRSRAVEEYDLLLVVGLLTAFTYVVFFAYIGKYALPAVPLVGAHLGVEAVRVLGDVRDRIGRPAAAAALAVAAGAFVYQLVIVGDVITGPEYRPQALRNFAGGLDDPRLPRLALSILPLVAVTLLARRTVVSRWLPALVIAAALTVVPVNLGETLATREHQRVWAVPSRQAGFKDAVGWLTQRVRPGSRVMAEIDFAYYVPSLEVVPHDARHYYPLDLLADALDDPRLRYVVVTEGEVPVDAGFLTRLTERYRPVETFGSFTIWRRVAHPPDAG